MEIINRDNPEFKKNDLRTGVPTLSIGSNEEGIYISKKACDLYELEAAQRVHFVYEVDRLYFFINYDHFGIPLTKAAKQRGLRLRSPGLVRTLKEKYPTKIKPDSVFNLRRCVSQINESKTIEVLLHKKI